MRKNLPVTDREKTFGSTTKLISVTDTEGTILECNDAFVEVSGFQKHELIGQPHNMVRHPDMPPEAYKKMWHYLKAGKPWMGLVKNRCKNGDYYWVDAYVTPVTQSGRIIGYESVRSCPSRQDVERATKLYRDINAGKSSRSTLPISLEICFLGIIDSPVCGVIRLRFQRNFGGCTTSLSNYFCYLGIIKQKENPQCTERYAQPCIFR